MSTLSLTMPNAAHALFNQIKPPKGLSFTLSLPNHVTRKTLDDSDNGKNLIHSKNADEMFEKLGGV